MKIHFKHRGWAACRPGLVWLSSQLTTVSGTARVDCRACQRTKAFREAVAAQARR